MSYTLKQTGIELDRNTTGCDLTVPTNADLLNIDTTNDRVSVGKKVYVEDDGGGIGARYRWTGGVWELDEIDVIDFNTSVPEPTHKVGRVHWNSAEETLELGINDEGVVLQMGFEFLARGCNNTGQTILNGSVVYINGVDAGCATIELANANLYDTSRALGVATQDILDGEVGIITKLGLVRDFDTSALSTGLVYLSDSVDGGLTNTQPIGGAFRISIGRVLVSDITNGLLFVDIDKSELAVEVTDTNGFPMEQNINLSLQFNDGTREFSIAPISGTTWHYYENGEKYEMVGTDTLTISDVEGLHAIYYNNGILQEVIDPGPVEIESLILDWCLVAYVYWEQTTQQSNYFANEKHGISMSPSTHLYNHFTRGAQYLNGLSLGDIVADGNGDLDTSAQFSSTLGFITDEDNLTSIPAIDSTVGLPIYYLEGTTPNVRRVENSGFSIATSGSGRMAWNENVGGNWQVSEVDNSDFALCHVFAINGADGYDKLIALMGQDEYGNANQARAGAEVEITTLLSLLPIQEKVPIATVIFQTNNGYDNGVKSRIRSTSDGQDYVDWTQTELTAGVVTDHNNLSGLVTTSGAGIYKHVSDSEPFQLPVFTTTERDAFTPSFGMEIANSTTGTKQFYNGTAWINS